jgi:hypothetical protein
LKHLANEFYGSATLEKRIEALAQAYYDAIDRQYIADDTLEDS